MGFLKTIFFAIYAAFFLLALTNIASTITPEQQASIINDFKNDSLTTAKSTALFAFSLVNISPGYDLFGGKVFIPSIDGSDFIPVIIGIILGIILFKYIGWFQNHKAWGVLIIILLTLLFFILWKMFFYFSYYQQGEILGLSQEQLDSALLSYNKDGAESNSLILIFLLQIIAIVQVIGEKLKVIGFA